MNLRKMLNSNRLGIPLEKAKFIIIQFLARHRTAAVAIVGPLPFALLGLALRLHHWWLYVLTIGTYSLLFLAAIAPHQYASINLLEMILKSIHEVLKLDKDKDRITLHHKKGDAKYEQITNYYPSFTGQGRSFTMGNGIVGRCFKSSQVLFTSLSQDQTLVDFAVLFWNFTPDEARRLTQDRRSFFSLPIGQD
ncbi:MAG: hypothetical protein ACRD4B_05120, partial [Acidobacteriota bacterium]